MFKHAKPIWIKNKRTTDNFQAGFRCDFTAEAGKEYKLKLTGATLYRVFLNGEFTAYGPARAGYGYLRCDEITLEVKPGINKVAVEVAGYNCASYYTLKNKSFLCAEIYEDDTAVKYTGKDFNAIGLEAMRKRECNRYSYQRAYGEIWDMDNSSELYNWTLSDNLEYDDIVICPKEHDFIERGMPMPDFALDNSAKPYKTGTWHGKTLTGLKLPRYVTDVGNYTDGFFKDRLPEFPMEELYGDFVPDAECKAGETAELGENEYVVYELDANNSGFIMNNITAKEDSSVYVFFSEYYFGDSLIYNAPDDNPNDVHSFEGQINIVKYNLKKSDVPYNLQTFETYTAKCIGIAVLKGSVQLTAPKLREYCYPRTDNASYMSDNEGLNKVYKASLNTFRQNTVDVYMDCPSRERGGWLCDSYFTAHAERMFSGDSRVEDAYLDNFVMAKEFPNIPNGMLPDVYPSEVKEPGSGYIPQWAMWYFVEVREYCAKRSKEDAAKYKDLFYGLIKWLERYENADGLLERMDGWNMYEWSPANDWVQDVHYPTNMLYYKILSEMGALYDDKKLLEKAKKVKNSVIRLSYNGKYFTDNAVLNEDGKLVTTGNVSETCQYFAYFCGIADEMEYPEWTERIINVLGDEEDTKALGIVPSAAFIGKYLRLAVLLRTKNFKMALHDIDSYFTVMADKTGTLWENDRIESARVNGGSLNHGFASYAGVVIAMASCGIIDIDYNNKTILEDGTYVPEVNFEFSMRTEDGDIKISAENGVKNINIPSNWTIKNA